MSIYSDVKNVEELLESCVDPETGEIRLDDFEAYEELKKEALAFGLEKLAKVRANKLALIEGVKSEQDRLKAKKAREEKGLDRLEEYMMFILSQDDYKTQTAGSFTVGIRKSTAVSVDADFSNDEYMRIKKEVDKTKLKDALKAGMEIKGAELVENKNLAVK